MHPALRRLDLNLLRVFDALYRQRTVFAAACELAISPSAFSHALGRLREALGDELFVRLGNGMHPTPRADALAACVGEAMQGLAEGLDRLEAFDPARSQRTFVFAATDYTAFVLLPGLMARLQRIAPGIRLRVVHGGRKVSLEDLASGRIDFALGYSEERDALPAGVESRVWLVDRYVVIAAREHPRIRGALDLEAYLAEKHVVVTPWGETRGVIDLVLDGLGRQREVALRLPTVMTAPFVVGAGELLMTVPLRAAEALARAADIALYPAPFPVEPYSLRLYCHRKLARTEAHGWMLGQLRELWPSPC